MYELCAARKLLDPCVTLHGDGRRYRCCNYRLNYSLKVAMRNYVLPFYTFYSLIQKEFFNFFLMQICFYSSRVDIA